MSRYSKVCLAALLLTLAFLIWHQPALAQAVREHDSVVSPVDFYVTPTEQPCLTETIHFLGTFRSQVNIISTPTGGFHLTLHQAGAAFKGVGETTGDTYKLIGPFSWTINEETASPVVDFTQNNRNIFVGPGQDAKLFLFTVTHFIYDSATGDVKLEVSKERVSCK